LQKLILGRYLQSVLRQNVAFFDKLGAGEVVNRISHDAELLRGGISEQVIAFQAAILNPSRCRFRFQDWDVSFPLSSSRFIVNGNSHSQSYVSSPLFFSYSPAECISSINTQREQWTVSLLPLLWPKKSSQVYELPKPMDRKPNCLNYMTTTLQKQKKWDIDKCSLWR